MSTAALDDAGLQDAAILLMSLGEEHAVEVFKLLAPKEVQRLGETIAKTRSVAKDRFDAVVERFCGDAAQHNALVPDNDAYVRSVLTRALGDDRAKLLLDRILQEDEVAGIECLKWMDAASVAELLRGEHPQIVAAILVHLDTDQVAEVLKQFDDEARNEVMIRVATLDGIQTAALQDLDDVLRRLLAGGDRARRASRGGVKSAAEIINLLGSTVETTVLDFIREIDDELAQKILDNLFTFDDLMKIDDRGIQTLLKEVQTESLIVSLKGATPQVRDKILKNMSARAAETLKEDLESRGPVRLSEVENEQKDILKTLRRLADEGQIVLGGGGDDQLV
jgi:flagellar motor switch protein FliG